MDADSNRMLQQWPGQKSIVRRTWHRCKIVLLLSKKVYNLLKNPSAEFVELVPAEEPKPVEMTNAVAASMVQCPQL